MKKYCDCVYFVDGGWCRYWNTTVTTAIAKVCRYRTLQRKNMKIRLTKVLK